MPEHNVAVQRARPALLLLLSLFLLPLTTFFIVLSYFVRKLSSPLRSSRRQISNKHGPKSRKRILISGPNTSAGLALARAFHAAGHVVVAADYEPAPFMAFARTSNAITVYRRLWFRAPQPRDILGMSDGPSREFQSSGTPKDDLQKMKSILSVIQHERPDVWIPCASVLSPRDTARVKAVVERHTSCHVIYPDAQALEITEDAARFSKFVADLGTDIRAPEIRVVSSRAEIHKMLGAWRSKRFALAPMDRGDDLEAAKKLPVGAQQHALSSSPDLIHQRKPEPLETVTLPRPTMNETYHCIAELHISKAEPYVLRELVSGVPYVAHIFVSGGKLQAFVAGEAIAGTMSRGTFITPEQSQRSSPAGGELRLLPPDAPLYDSLLTFADKFAYSLGNSTTAHLTLNFVVSETRTPTGTNTTIYPIACDPQPSASIALLAQTQDGAQSLANMHIKASSAPQANGHPVVDAIPPISAVSQHTSTVASPLVTASQEPHPLTPSTQQVLGIYSLPTASMNLVVSPLLQLMSMGGSFEAVVGGVMAFLERLFLWREEVWDWQDLWPWWWKWHVYFPMAALLRRKDLG